MFAHEQPAGQRAYLISSRRLMFTALGRPQPACPVFPLAYFGVRLLQTECPLPIEVYRDPWNSRSSSFHNSRNVGSHENSRYRVNSREPCPVPAGITDSSTTWFPLSTTIVRLSCHADNEWCWRGSELSKGNFHVEAFDL